jgi:hypothetical protein
MAILTPVSLPTRYQLAVLLNNAALWLPRVGGMGVLEKGQHATRGVSKKDEDEQYPHTHKPANAAIRSERWMQGTWLEMGRDEVRKDGRRLDGYGVDGGFV